MSPKKTIKAFTLFNNKEKDIKEINKEFIKGNLFLKKDISKDFVMHNQEMKHVFG